MSVKPKLNYQSVTFNYYLKFSLDVTEKKCNLSSIWTTFKSNKDRIYIKLIKITNCAYILFNLLLLFPQIWTRKSDHIQEQKKSVKDNKHHHIHQLLLKLPSRNHSTRKYKTKKRNHRRIFNDISDGLAKWNFSIHFNTSIVDSKKSKCLRMYAWLFMCVSLSVSMSVSMCICVCVCVCVF